MKLQINMLWLKKIGCSDERRKQFNSWNYNDDRLVEIDHLRLSADEFTQLYELTNSMIKAKSKAEGLYGLNQKLGSLMKLMKAPESVKVSNLKELEAAMTEFVRRLPNNWLFTQVMNVFLPVVVTKVEYEPPRRLQPAKCELTYAWYELGQSRCGRIVWSMSDLLDRNELKARGFFDEERSVLGTDVIDDDIDDDSGEAPKSKRKCGRTLVELLTAKGFMVETPEAVAAYEKLCASFPTVSAATGAQYVAANLDTKMLTVQRYSSHELPLVTDGALRKLVVDDTRDPSDESDTRKTDSQRISSGIVGSGLDAAVPLHPFVAVFDLTSHAWGKVLSSDIMPYKYDRGIASQLVLPGSVKQLIEILIDGAKSNIADIISGKSTGTFILSTGEPGTGKTLTAEVYSERMERPLYSVQCSQLGTNENELEQRLNLVLSRASRWGAILLIDEADVYVNARGGDIQQNAIVGVFLRLLERYRGVIFMTSNLDSVDDAIYSRATAHVEYVLPNESDLARIFEIQLGLAGVREYEAGLPQKLAKCMRVSGRTARQLVRLALKVSQGKPLIFDDFAHVAQFQHKSVTWVAVNRS